MGDITAYSDVECLCCFCGKQASEQYGKFFSDNSLQISLHQYCMFFASGLAQKGGDNEGFDGFLPQDIIKEVNRTKKLRCSRCKKSGASVGCAISYCKINCHYPCGLEVGMLHQFFGDFRSYCSRHKPVQDVSNALLLEKSHYCAICLEKLITKPGKVKLLKMPCCKDNLMHQDCLQQQALSSGYFFRCPTCNNQDMFLSEMKKFGIYIPDRDAAWEDGTAYTDFLESYSCCDAECCACPKGRQQNQQTGHWKILRCENCGQSGIHTKCARLANKPTRVYVCAVCLEAHNNAVHGSTIVTNTKFCYVFLEDALLASKARFSSPSITAQVQRDDPMIGTGSAMTNYCINASFSPCHGADTSNEDSSETLSIYSKYRRCKRHPFLKGPSDLKCGLYNYLTYVLINNADN